ncbi:MAG: M3 family oligoendopeptidase [Nitrospiraceae bacterium]|nr:M3 family oligoendopeptidase [Nitrospiraceae bacterium]
MPARRTKEKSKPYEWDLSPLMKSDDDPRIEKNLRDVERESRLFIDKWQGRTDYLREPLVMKEALDEYERWRRTCGSDGDAGYYFWLRAQQDMNDPALKARLNRAEDFSRKIENDMQFFHLRISRIPKNRQKRFLGHPALEPYRYFLERIFEEAAHLLSEPEEKIMNLKSATSYSGWTRMTAGFLAREERQVLLENGKKGTRTLSAISSLASHKTKKVRDVAALAFDSIMAQYADVAEAEMNAVLANKKTDDDLRGFTRPDQSRHLSDDIGSDVVDTLVRTVSDRFSVAGRFYALKARLMKVTRLAYHERNVEYGNITIKYPYGKAMRLVGKVMQDLDKDFAEIFRSFADNGQFDAYPRKGKGGGAFCAHHLASQPTYILLNHTGTLHDVLTIAHELGHGINNELVRRSRHALYFGTPTSTAEVASTFMEDFVLHEILGRSDDDARLSIMMMKLNDDVSTIFRQVACYRFEQELHESFRQKGYLSKDEIGSIFQGHMAAYMGDAVEQSKGSRYWWVYWSHIRYFFYVYSYASGLLISKSLQRSVKQNPAFISKVKEFLSAGLSESPRNIFGRLGVDIADKAFWSRGIDEVEALLEETAALAEKMGRLKGV